MFFDKTYYSCERLSRGIFIGTSGVAPCCNELSNEVSIKNGDWLLQFQKKKMEQLIDINCNSLCRLKCLSCGELKLKEWGHIEEKYSILSIGTNVGCNFRCIYCDVANNEYGRVEVLDVLEYLIVNKKISEGGLYDWGGKGEPAIDRSFDQAVRILCNLGWSGKIYTNCSVFSDSIFENISKNRLTLVTSLDSGTPETFQRVKRRPVFQKVLENLFAYAANAKQAISLKYILMECNSSNDDIYSFINIAKKINVNYVIISKNMKTGPVSEAMLPRFALLKSLCIGNNLPYILSGIALREDTDIISSL